MAKQLTFTVEDNETGVLLRIPTEEINNILPALTNDRKANIVNPDWAGPGSVDGNGDPIPEFIPNPVSVKNYALNRIGKLLEDYVYNYNRQTQKAANNAALNAIQPPNVIAAVEDQV